MNTRPLVVIVVLNYNGKECLSSALRSLESLEYAEKKIIIVDNHSQDDSFLLAKSSFPQGIFLSNRKNLGFSAGMNVGIREALRLGAEYVWLFNNDAETEKDTLSHLVDFCERHDEAGAASPIILDYQGKEWFTMGKISFFRMRAFHGKKKGKKKGDYTPYQSEYLSGCALLLRASTIKAVGLLDERYFLYYEDADLSLRIWRIGKKLFVIPSALVRHGERSEQENPKKIYYLVYSGLLFFHDHASRLMWPWILLYESLRRLKNQGDMLLSRKNALEVRRAYDDYDRISQN